MNISKDPGKTIFNPPPPLPTARSSTPRASTSKPDLPGPSPTDPHGDPPLFWMHLAILAAELTLVDSLR